MQEGREGARKVDMKALRHAGERVTANAVPTLNQQETDLEGGGRGGKPRGARRGRGARSHEARGARGELDRQPSPDRAILRGEEGPGG